MNPLEKKQLVRTTLRAMTKMKDRPLKPDGNLVTEAFNRLPAVQEVITRLKEAGITREWLVNNGFVMAGMVLIF